jgi:hypothetical protein
MKSNRLSQSHKEHTSFCPKSATIDMLHQMKYCVEISISCEELFYFQQIYSNNEMTY